MTAKLDYSPLERAWNGASYIGDQLDRLSGCQAVIHARRSVDGALCVLDAIIAGRNIRVLEVFSSPNSKLVFKFNPVTIYGLHVVNETDPSFSLHTVSRLLFARYTSLTG